MSDFVKVGQIWQRKNGMMVEITDKMKSKGLDVFQLTPIDSGGRKSWKWDEAIISELTFVAKSKKAMIL